MTTPAYLEQGDKIGIVAPAKFISQEKYPQIIQFIEKKGFVPVRGETTFLESGMFAGTDEQRRKDLQKMMDDENLKAIFCLRGGYGTMRIIDRIQMNTFAANPKWIVGFSDITALHALISKTGIESIHGQMPVNFSVPSPGLEQLFAILKGEPLSYTLPAHELNRVGESKAVLLGGNISLICALLCTPFAYQTKGAVLFIEEVGEHLYRFDRMLQQLKLAGILQGLSGLVVGGLTSMEDQPPTFGLTAEQIVKEAVKEYHYPVCFGFPAGHLNNNYPLIINREIVLNVGKNTSSLIFCDRKTS